MGLIPNYDNEFLPVREMTEESQLSLASDNY